MLPRNVGQRCLFASDTPVDIPRTSQGTSFVNALHGIPCLSLALEWFYRRIWLCAAFAIQHQLHPFARHVEPISTLFSSLPILLRSLLTLLRAPQAQGPSYYSIPVGNAPSPYDVAAAVSLVGSFGPILLLLIAVAIILGAIIYGPSMMQDLPKARVSLLNVLRTKSS